MTELPLAVVPAALVPRLVVVLAAVWAAFFALREPPVPVSVIGIDTVLFRGVVVTARVLTPGFATVGAELILLTPRFIRF